MKNIEIVPSHTTGTNTDFIQPSGSGSQNFKAWQPSAPHPYQSSASAATSITPLPQSQAPQISDRDKELLERRKNWVFLTPDDYTKPDDKTGANSKDPRDPKKADDAKLTPMEKYLQRLSGTQQGAAGATNRLDKMDSDQMNETNYLVGGEQKKNGADPFAANPFSPTADNSIFQTLQRGDFGSAGFFSGDPAQPTPEDLRAQADQKARMESYKQLFNFDTATSPSATVSPANGPMDSAPLFGVSTPSAQPGFSAMPVIGNAARAQQQAPPPIIAPTRIAPPPHADFSAPQRPF